MSLKNSILTASALRNFANARPACRRVALGVQALTTHDATSLTNVLTVGQHRQRGARSNGPGCVTRGGERGRIRYRLSSDGRYEIASQSVAIGCYHGVVYLTA